MTTPGDIATTFLACHSVVTGHMVMMNIMIMIPRVEQINMDSGNEIVLFFNGTEVYYQRNEDRETYLVNVR